MRQFVVSILVFVLYFSATLAQSVIVNPAITLKVWRDEGQTKTTVFEMADWTKQELSAAELEIIAQTYKPFTELKQIKYSEALARFLKAGSYWRLARLGVWIRFPDRTSVVGNVQHSQDYIYYFLPYHVPAAEVLAFFNQLSFQDERVDLVVDPTRKYTDTGELAKVSAHLYRLAFRDLHSMIKSPEENMLSLIQRLGMVIESGYSDEVKNGAEPEDLISACTRYTRELAFKD